MAVPEGRLKGHTGSMDAALGDGTIQFDLRAGKPAAIPEPWL